ncbi:MAG: leucine-rich repeat protein [Alistipes sp.]|nr:leucine-rich repeat protein [Alistipes sp.]
MKKNYYLFFAILMVLLHSCKGDDPTINNQPNNVEVEDITLNYATLSLEVGQSKQLIASIHPSDATDTRIMWISDNSSIADVDNGLVIAYKPGTAIITASTYDGVHSAQCKVTVAREEEEIINVTSVSLNKTSLSLKEGESVTLSCTVQPSNATDKSVRWISSNTSVASVNNNGKVTALKEGTSTITVTTNDGGYTAKCTVTVNSQNQSKAKIVKLYADVSYTGWNQCNIYIWDSAGEWAVWPGKPIEKTTIDGKSYYVFAFDKSAYGKTISVIFNNGSGEQTVDITDVTLNKDYVFKLTQKNNEGKWTANISSSVPNNVYSVVGSFNDWSTDVMFEAMGDGGYGLLGLSLTAKDEFKIRANKDWVETGNFGLPSVSTLVTNAANNLIVGYDSQNMKVANDGVYDFYFYPSELTLYVMESEDDPTPPSDAKPVKLYANVSATGWSKCNIYIWDNLGQYFNWPGVGIQKTTVSGNTYYVYTCDVNMYGKTVSIIFNNGTEQTADIPNVVLNKDYVFTLTQKNNEGKWQANASTSFENSLVLTSNSNNDIPASASEYEISFTSPSNWTASTDCSWITLSSSSGVAGQQTITANIAKNLSTSQRKGNVTIKSGNDSKKVTYTQAGATNSDDDDDDNNNISPDNHSEISYKFDLNNLFNKSDDSACEEMLNEVYEQYDMSGFGAEFIEAKYSNGWVTLCFDKDVTSVPYSSEIGYASSADTIVLPNSVTEIADHAFRNCNNASINLPESLQYIGSYAFYGNKRMEELNLPIKVVSIGESAFSDCISLVRVIIPNSVTTIGKNIFKGCNSLTSVTIPNSVTTIGESAFDDCSSLTSLTIPNSVTTIGESAFDDCSSLTSLTIPNSVTSIGGSAFSGCSSLTKVTIPDSVTEIGYGAFKACTGELIINNNAIIETDYTTNNYPSYSWLSGAKFTKLTIGNSATEIGIYAFTGCSSFTSVTIPNSVTTIGDYAFSDCSSLTSLTIPNSVTTIGKSAFDDCSSLTSLTIPNSVTTIGDRAFCDCSSLTSVTIPNSVTTIGMYAFENCSSLTSVTIPNSVTSIGGSAFSGCTGELIINNKVLVETDYMLGVGTYPSYYGWLAGVKFTKLTIGNGIMKIGMFAFYDCSSFISVTIPDSVTSIEASAFSKCSNLTSVTIPDSVTTIEHYTFKNCSNLTSIVIPNSVTTVGTEVFYNCSSLTSVTIPDSVTSIGEKAFYECSSLTSVTIGSSLALIGDQAFYDCISLKSVYCKATTPPMGGYSMFSGNASGRKIYVPMESVEAYKFAYPWSEYKSDIVGYNF